jgi:hypothetical protein
MLAKECKIAIYGTVVKAGERVGLSNRFARTALKTDFTK